jgi:GDPmannose 4,6-dehydratase
VTRKITRALAAIQANKQELLFLGNLDARRDWGYAPDYEAAMWKMLQCEGPGDFVIGTGEAHSVREFLDEAFGYLNLDWHAFVKIDPRYYRPNEVDFLQADPGKARKELDWEPRRSSRIWYASWSTLTWKCWGSNPLARERRSSRIIIAIGIAGIARL